jgi:hypothetical protein
VLLLLLLLLQIQFLRTEDDVADRPMTELEAKLVASEYRAEFRNSDAFEHAWSIVFDLRTPATLALCRRILGQELLKYRAHLAGLEARDFQAPTAADSAPRSERDYRCPGCSREIGEWDRSGHAEDCPYAGSYELEVRCSRAIAARNAAHAQRHTEPADATPA